MNDFIYTFFEYNPNINEFQIFGRLHLLMMLIIFSILILIVTFREKLKVKITRKDEIALGLILVIPRLLMYVWYFMNETTLQELLPLYLCRIVIICTAYTLFTGKDKLHYVVYYWGLFGSILALIFPDTSGYNIPHVMFFSFFIGHGALAISIFYIVFVKGFVADKKNLVQIIKLTTIYILVTCIINKLVGGNYNYLETNPVSVPLPMIFVKSIFYKLTILGVFILLALLEYLPFEKRRKHCNRYEIGFDR